jgi:hypothetical protein
VIYATQLQKKNKVYYNGSFLLHPDNHRIVLLDDIGITIDAKVLRINESIFAGMSFEFPCHIVKVASEQNGYDKRSEDFALGHWIWKVCYTTEKDLDRRRQKKYDGTLRFWSSNGWLVLLNAREEPIAVKVLSKGHSIKSDSEVSFPHHLVTVGPLFAGSPPMEDHPASPPQSKVETQTGQSMHRDTGSPQQEFIQQQVVSPCMDHAQNELSQLQLSLDFSNGQAFKSQVRKQFGTTVHPLGKANHFLMVVSFGRAKFKLTEVTVGLALESCLGGLSMDFSVLQLYDRVFRFSVASRHVGFMVYSIRKFSTEQFKCYFHLWGFGGPNWRKEFASWQQECNEEWTLVSPNKKRTASALNALHKKPDRPILQHKNSAVSVKKFLSFAEVLVYEACTGYSMKDDSLKNVQDPKISEQTDVVSVPTANGQIDNEVDPFDKLVDDMAYRVWNCGRCLSMSHKTSVCTNEIRCRGCFSYGHIRKACLKAKKATKWIPKQKETGSPQTLTGKETEPDTISGGESVNEQIPPEVQILQSQPPETTTTQNPTPPPLSPPLLSPLPPPLSSLLFRSSMANFEVDPAPWLPPGHQIIDGGPTRLPPTFYTPAVRPPRRNETICTAELLPPPPQALVPFWREQVRNFVLHNLHIDVEEVKPSIFGLGFFRLRSPAARAALVAHVPYQLQNGVFVRFVNHDDRDNHRAVQGFRSGWLMFLAIPLDFRNEYDISNAIATFGRFHHWHQDENMVERTLVYASFPSPALVPRDVVFGDYANIGGVRES